MLASQLNGQLTAVFAALVSFAATPSIADPSSAALTPRRIDAVWRCDVVAGPSLRQCKVLSPRSLDPQKAQLLARFAEWIPACDLPGARVGSTYQVRYGLYDEPQIWDRLDSGEWLPDWAKRLTASDLFYPQGAKQGGQAAVRCRVTLSGVPADCIATMENPPGLGFGEAAIKTAGRACFFPEIVDGAPVDSGVIEFPIAFGAPSPHLLRSSWRRPRTQAFSETPRPSIKHLGPVSRRARGLHGMSGSEVFGYLPLTAAARTNA
jgi:protein TonB